MSTTPPPPPGPGAGAPPPGASPGPYPSSSGPASAGVPGSGFFAALFDFSFSRFITPMIIRFVYILATALIGLTWFALLITSFASSAASGLVVLLLGPVVALVYLAFVRMTLEIYLAVVRMSEDIHQRLPHS